MYLYTPLKKPNKQIKNQIKNKTKQKKQQQKTSHNKPTKQKLKQNKKQTNASRAYMYLDMETVLFRPRLIRLISPHIFMGDWKQNIEILVLFFFYTFIYHSCLCPQKLKS